jgi:hypothetical protein
MSLRRIANSSQALAHLQKELAEGSSLAKLVLRKTSFAEGKFFAGIPDGVDQSQLDFRSSISGLRDEPSAFAHAIKSFIDGPHHYVLLEDTIPMFSDPSEENGPYRARMTIHGEEIFWNLSGPGLSEDDIFALLGTPILPYPSSAFFYLTETSEPKSQLRDSDLELIVNSLVGVAVWAFDTQSFLIWWRENLQPFPKAETS